MDLRQRFRALHESPFIIPNPWDIGSARPAGLARLQRPGDHQLRPRRLPGTSRRRRHTRRGDLPRPSSGRRNLVAGQCRSRANLADTISRLQAYQEAGADVLYAPGLQSLDEIRSLTSSVDRPVNVLILPGGPSIPELFDAGARRVSVARPDTLAGKTAGVGGRRRQHREQECESIHGGKVSFARSSVRGGDQLCGLST